MGSPDRRDARPIVDGAPSGQVVQLVELSCILGLHILGPVSGGEEHREAPVVERFRCGGQQKE